MAYAAHKVESIVKVGPLPKNPMLYVLWLALIGVGAYAFYSLLQTDASRAWHNFVLNYFFWFCIALAGPFFVALQYVTGSIWSIGLRRVAEALTAFLPVVALLAVVLVLYAKGVYEWSDPAVVAADPHLAKKASYLNWNSFTTRHLLSLGVLMLLGLWMLRNSLKQDQTKDARLTVINNRIAPAFIILFALLFSLASFDVMMAIEPKWFSTMFGVYGFAGLFQSGIAMMIVIATLLYRKGRFGAYVRGHDHIFDLGKLLFAFTIFWAYIAFSQYMLIWYPDLPEETFYFLERTTGPWANVSWLLLFGRFVIPFLALLSQDLKRVPGYIAVVAVWQLAMQYVDCYWIVFPHYNTAAPIFGWQEIAIFAGFVGVFGAWVTCFLNRNNLVPLGDPRLAESVEFHQ